MKDKAILVIDMPKSCWECPCLDSEWGNCHVLGDDRDCIADVYDRNNRLQNCPLKPLDDEVVYNQGWIDCFKRIIGRDE